MNELWMFLLIWGVWILMPIIVDGVDTVVRLFVVLIWGRNFHVHNQTDDELPLVTILVPAYNEELVIDRCLNSIKTQDYPHEKLEVVVINDGSSDMTADKIMSHLDPENGNGSSDNGFRADGGNHNGNHKSNGNGDGNGGSAVPPGVYKKSDFTNGSGNGNGYHNGNGNGHNGNGSNGNGNGLLLNGNHVEVPEFNGEMTLVSHGHQGKPAALNHGVKHMNGSELVITVDSDVVLAPDAIRNMACAFLENPDMGAATGHIEVSEDIIEERDEYDNLVLDEEGKLKTMKLSAWQMLLTKCQFLEYLDAFRLGRQFQAVIGSTYILAGAFSAFRRSTLMETQLYKPRTVSEDFDLTVDIHRTKSRIGYVADAKAFLEPITSWNRLYSQRVRWCRGQLEVCGVHKDMIGNRKYGTVGWFGLPQMLIVDHTLAFPRLLWTFLILLFPLLGYPFGTVAMAILFMYVFYVALVFIQTAASYSIVDDDTKKRTESAFAWCLILPLYRLVVFYFRMSGYLRTLKEPARWTIDDTLLSNSSRNFETFRTMATSILGALNLNMAHDGNGHQPKLNVRYRRAMRSYKAFLRHRLANDGNGLDGDEN